MAAVEAARVVMRCEEAKETGILDLSGCDLRQVPTCLYLLMANTTVTKCDFSNNVIKRIPAKLGEQFTSMTELILQENKLSSLPETLTLVEGLLHLNVSSNIMESVPEVIYSLPSLRSVNLSGNSIKELDVERLLQRPSLTAVNLENNPLSDEVKQMLRNSTLDIKL